MHKGALCVCYARPSNCSILWHFVDNEIEDTMTKKQSDTLLATVTVSSSPGKTELDHSNGLYIYRNTITIECDWHMPN